MASRSAIPRALTTFLFILIAICSGGQSPHAEKTPSSPSGHKMGRRLTMVGIPNFAEATPMLYRGGQPIHAGFEGLAKMGVDLIVDVRGTDRESEGNEVNTLGMKYAAIPWHCPFPKDKTFVKFLKLLRDNPGKKVFVHCRLGDDRSGMMIAAYRMAVQGWTAEEALNEMKAFGFSRSHHFICPRLESYEKHFPEHLKTNPEFDGLYKQ
jgi:tyrosine-protein phosphatase SIW14